MTNLDSNRDALLMQKMCRANELGSTYIFVSITGIAIIAENHIFVLECEDGLKNEFCKKVQFDNYDDLIEYINDFYDYNKIENEFANMEGRVYTQRSYYEYYIELKKPKVWLSKYRKNNELAQHERLVDVYIANNIIASEYFNAQQISTRSINSIMLYSEESDDQ